MVIKSIIIIIYTYMHIGFIKQQYNLAFKRGLYSKHYNFPLFDVLYSVNLLSKLIIFQTWVHKIM